MAEKLMDSTAVSWEALDGLVTDFVRSEKLIEDDVDVGDLSSSYSSRLIIRGVRRFLELGDIDAALHLLGAHAPFILQDHRLLFLLHKQKFIELLRRDNRDSALHCLRTALAPCALDAYPEAYEEFKHLLLAFIYDKNDQTSPVVNEWSERRRYDIAGLMSTVLRAHFQAYDPLFSMTLRYLISIHKGFCLRQGITSPISDLTERLLLDERDPPTTPQESLYEVPPFDEVDVQALAHAVELTRQGAVDSLRVSKGDLFQAFQSELCRMKLDVPLLDELVREYCIYRGIVDSGFGSSSGIQAISDPLKSHEAEGECCSSRNSSLELECETKHSDGETAISDACTNASIEVKADSISTQEKNFEIRYSFEVTNHSDDCSTSGTQPAENSKHVQRSRSYLIEERSRRKRWRGRNDDINFMPEILSTGSYKQDIGSTKLANSAILLTEQKGLEKYPTSDIINRDDKYGIVLAMSELASRGMVAEVCERVNNLDPQFFVQNPLLLFQLKQVEFLKLVGTGDHSSALRVACSYLGPLAARDSTLLKPLKETLLSLLEPDNNALGRGLPLHVLGSSLQVAIGRRLGIEEPQLMKLLRAAVHTHNEWFRLQMCKDRFEGLLRIDLLKDINSPPITDRASKSKDYDCTQGSSQVTVSSSSRMPDDASSTAQVSSTETGVCDENAILKVMEFLALPRADAIHLLIQYNGNAETGLDELEDAKDAPEAVLKGARHMAAVEISCEPCVRKHVRRIFMDNAMVSTSPTPNGNVAIDALHQFAGVKWL